MAIHIKHDPWTSEELKNFSKKVERLLDKNRKAYEREAEQKNEALIKFDRVNGKTHEDKIYTRQFRLSNIMKAFSLKKNFVLNLVSSGIVKPFKDVKGRGGTRVYSYWNLIQIVLFSYLIKLGISYSQAKSVLEHLEEFIMGEMKYFRLILHIIIAGFVDGESKIGVVTYDPGDAVEPSPGITLSGFIDKLENENLDPKKISFFYILNIRSISQYVDERIKDI